MKLYLYKNCDTCRKAQRWLQSHGLSFETVPIREQPPTAAELKGALEGYGGELRRLFNTSGQDYKALGLAGRLPTLSVDEALALLNGNGNLVKRPFLVPGNGQCLVGFHEEEWRNALLST